MITPSGPLIYGEVLFDCFEDGSRVLGGAPFNVAWHLQAFDAAPLFVSRIGDDTQGSTVRKVMTQWGMDTSGVQVDPSHATGEVSVTLSNGQPSYEIVSSRAFDYIDTSLPAAFGHPALLYHGTLALRHEVSGRSLTALRDGAQLPVFLDLNLRAPWWSAGQLSGLIDHASWLKINDEELRIVTGGGHDSDLLLLAQGVMERHPQLQLMMITLGAAGALFVSRNQPPIHAPLSASTTVVDTVGAGDAFAAVSLLGILHGWSSQQILERAQAFATRIVGVRGATSDNRSIYSETIASWS